MAFNGAIAVDQRYVIQDISPEAPEQELLDAVHFRGEQEMARVASELMHTSCMYDNDVCLDQTAVYNKLTAGVARVLWSYQMRSWLLLFQTPWLPRSPPSSVQEHR